MANPPDRQRFVAALDALPQLSRAVYLLSATDGLDHDRIAFRLGLTIGEVERHLAEALLRLDQMLSGHSDSPDAV